ncbi:MAG: Asp-tRNA(Asn)/Glu-tRNA(Gln) amidotransferase subunit GatC [Bacteroidota bacterium]
MPIELSTLEKLAHLSRLELDPATQEQMLGDLNRMVAFVEKLSEVDTTGVEPLTTMTHEINQVRPDVPATPLDGSAVFKNAPEHKDGFFRVPKVIG